MSKYYLYDGEDFIWFFKNEDGKLKYFASWTIASLGLVDWEEVMEKASTIEEDSPYQFHAKHYTKTDNWLKSLGIKNVQPVGEKLTAYLEEIQSNGIGHMFLTGTLENPTEDEDFEYEDE